MQEKLAFTSGDDRLSHEIKSYSFRVEAIMIM